MSPGQTAANSPTAALLKEYRPLVVKIARRLHARLPASVDVDDMIQAGMIGLNAAIGRFDSALGLELAAYVIPAVRGAMLDELRQQDNLPVSARRKVKSAGSATRALEHRFGRAPLDSEVASELGISAASYQALMHMARASQHSSMTDDEEGASAVPDPSGRSSIDRMQDAERRQALEAAIKQLPEREQTLMRMYYAEGAEQQEVAAVLAVTPSRVSQMHSAIVAKLRIRLRAYGERS